MPHEYEIGQFLAITENTSGHGFNIGEVVELTRIFTPVSCMATSEKGHSWFLSPSEMSPLLNPETNAKAKFLLTETD